MNVSANEDEYMEGKMGHTAPILEIGLAWATTLR